MFFGAHVPHKIGSADSDQWKTAGLQPSHNNYEGECYKFLPKFNLPKMVRRENILENALYILIYIWKIICFHAVFDLNQSLIEPKVNLETQASWLQDESEGGCLAGNPWVVRDSIAPVIAPVPSHLPQL